MSHSEEKLFGHTKVMINTLKRKGKLRAWVFQFERAY